MNPTVQEDPVSLFRHVTARLLLGSGAAQAEDSFELLQAQLAILNVTHLYMDAANRKDATDFASCFTTDGALAIYLPSGAMLRESVGRPAIMAAGQRDWEAVTTPAGFEERHLAFQTFFVNLSRSAADTRTVFGVTKLDFPTGDDAKAKGPAAAAKVTFRYTGLYKSQFVRTDEGWKMKRREIHFD